MSPEGCQAKKPWHHDCDIDALRMALRAVAEEDIAAVKAVECMTAVTLGALVEIRPMFTECLRDSLKEARLERWNKVGYAGQVWRQAGKKGALTYTCTACQPTPKDEA